MAEEEHKQITLKAKRVAFSAYGSVTTLHGLPVTEGSVVARSGEAAEFAKIQEPHGEFRIMGLQPGKAYSISVESAQIDRALPVEKVVIIAPPSETNPNSDITNLRFAAIEKPKSVSISGVAFFEDEETVKKNK